MSIRSPFQVPVEGGMLSGAIWEPEGATASGPGADGLPILAIHGITATHLSWQFLSTALPDARIIAPDLRGRGRSNVLPGPYGLRQHAMDIADLLDAIGVPRVRVVGHSMGAFVAVRCADLYPGLVESLVLIDGGLPISRPPGVDPAAMLGPAAERLTRTFVSREAYRQFWREHPAFADSWSAEVAVYSDYDLDGVEPELHPSTSVEAMAEDVMQLDGSDGYAQALRAVHPTVDFLRSPRGLMNEHGGLYSAADIDAFAGQLPGIGLHNVDNTNHYSIIMTQAGADAVASVINAQASHPDPVRKVHAS